MPNGAKIYQYLRMKTESVTEGAGATIRTWQAQKPDILYTVPSAPTVTCSVFMQRFRILG